MNKKPIFFSVGFSAAFFAALIMMAPGMTSARSNDDGSSSDDNSSEDHQRGPSSCRDLPDWHKLKRWLTKVADDDDNGLDNEMWAVIIDAWGRVCAVAFTGETKDQQWLLSRVIAAQKAYAANGLSHPLGAGQGGGASLALSTANLYSAVQPGGSLFGLQHSNPVNPKVAYRGPYRNWGQKNDPLVHRVMGGVNVFGGGLALYFENGERAGALGVSGDTSCRDHIIAWKLRDEMELDHVAVGLSPTGDDNMILDTTVDPTTGHTTSPSGFGHPLCGGDPEKIVIESLPDTHPIGPNP